MIEAARVILMVFSHTWIFNRTSTRAKIATCVFSSFPGLPLTAWWLVARGSIPKYGWNKYCPGRSRNHFHQSVQSDHSGLNGVAGGIEGKSSGKWESRFELWWGHFVRTSVMRNSVAVIFGRHSLHQVVVYLTINHLQIDKEFKFIDTSPNSSHTKPHVGVTDKSNQVFLTYFVIMLPDHFFRWDTIGEKEEYLLIRTLVYVVLAILILAQVMLFVLWPCELECQLFTQDCIMAKLSPSSVFL